MSYSPNPNRYENMLFRKCGNSGLKLPAISLGLWHNFGEDFTHHSKREICRSAFDHGIMAGESFNGIANMGIRPTVDGSKPVLEIHIFDFSESIYGQRLTVEFKNKLRDEKKFDNIDLLKEQILQDISQAKEILE